MKDLNEISKLDHVEKFQIWEDGGQFDIRIDNSLFCIIASFDGGGDHVSALIYHKERCPKWIEMCIIKNIFFDDEDFVIQYHPSKSDYINNFKYCIHLWKPQGIEIPKSSKIMV